MPRRFNQHVIRSTACLDGAWDFYFPQQGTLIDPAAWRDGVREPMDVPCVWEMLDARKTYRGQAVARREIVVPRDGRLLLTFKGVSHTARVYLDGREIGGHHNAFTAFTVDAAMVRAGSHELLVHISNEHGALSALHIPNDYYNYGGISRPVDMHLVSDAAMIRYVHAQSIPEEAGWRLACRAEIINFAGSSREFILQADVAGIRVSRCITAPPGASLHAWDMSCGPVKSWSPEEPELYLLQTILIENDRPVDDLIERIGFRSVSVMGERILINGMPVFPMGFNRHEDHARYGCAIPVDVMRSDLARMKTMHANAVRTCHYPNDERFLDLCDEAGMLVWEENHARGLNLEKMLHPRFREQCAACNAEMVEQHVNHPCIFVWGILNECASETEAGAALFQEQFDQLRTLDPARPVTFASCRYERDLCQGMVDIAGWNIYPQWYHDRPVRETLDELIARREPEGMTGKPLIISEFGAGGIPGYHDPVRRAKWSEERQCDILDRQLGVILNHPRVGGAFIWQFCDVRVDEAIAMGRPRCINDKGVVDGERRPKLAVDVVKRHFTEKQAAFAVERAAWQSAGGMPHDSMMPVPRPGRVPRQRRTILVKSGWQNINIGDIGHSPGLFALLERHAPGAHLVFWPYDSDPEVDAMMRRRFPRIEIVHGKVEAGGTLNPHLASVFARADLLIHGSGPSVVAWQDLDDWHRITGKPYGIYGVTFGEIGGDLKALLDQAAFVFTRESLSLEILHAAGVTCPVMGFAPDACVALDVRDDDKALAWIRRAGLEEGRYLCAIPRNRMTPYHWSKTSVHWNQSHIREVEDFNHQHREADLSKFREAIIIWVRETGLPVMLCPEMVDALALLGPHVYAPLPGDVRPHIIMRDKWWLTDEAASIYMRASAMLSLDCHSPLIAYANGTPAVYVYQPQDARKAHMYQDFGLGGWLMPIAETDGRTIAERLLVIHGNPHAARQTLARCMAEINHLHRNTLGQALEQVL